MNKTTLLIICIIATLLLAGCQQAQPTEPTQQKTPTTEPAKTQTQPKTEPSTEPTQQATVTEHVIPSEEPETTPTQTTQQTTQMSPALKELLTKYQRKVRSYQFLFSKPPENRFLNTYHIKGDKIKIKLYEGNAYKVGKYYDTVYLDKSKQTATARCESEKRCSYAGEDYTGKVFEVSYDDFVIETPIEWIEGITQAELIGPEVVDGRSATKIKTTQSGKIIELWIDTTYGLPLKKEITQTGQPVLKYQVNDVIVNHLADSDVMPAFTTDRY